MANTTISTLGVCAECGTAIRAATSDGLCAVCLLSNSGIAFAADVTRAPPSDSEPTAPVKRTIGPYRVLNRLGSGGFGDVFLADQEEPLKRRVALKILKAEIDSHTLRTRFESERKTLALLDHPNIARIYDAGFCEEDGRPFFAMEYVEGERLQDFLRTSEPPLNERLRLYLLLCDAVAHAHQKGVIHRDLKPSNILIAGSKDNAVPKLIDFGVAKATEHILTDATIFTRAGEWLGTPAYMSPEQISGGGLATDTRSDIYALGVILYEMLTGEPPFSNEQLSAQGYAKMASIVQQQQPQRPSTVTTGSDSIDSSQLTSELDWIALKALEKDPERRFQSASELAADIHRYLEGRPILARPPSRLYLLGKFVSRHRLPVALAALTIACVVAAALISSLMAYRAEHQRAIAEDAKTDSDTARVNLTKANSRLGYLMAAELSGNDRHRQAVAQLCNALRTDPDNFVARYRLCSLLAGFNFPRLAEEPVTHESWVSFAGTTPDGSRIITCSQNGTLRIRDADGSPEGEIVVQGQGSYVAISPDSQIVAVGSGKGTIGVWEIATGTPRPGPLRHGRDRVHIAFGNDGHLYSAGNDGCIGKWSKDYSSATWSAPQGAPATSIAVTYSAPPLVIGGFRNGIVSAIDTTAIDQEPVWSTRPHQDSVYAIVAPTSIERIVTGGKDQTIQFIDASTGKALQRERLTGRVYRLRLSDDQNLVAVSSFDKSGRVFRISDGKEIKKSLHDEEVYAAALSPDGRWFATASRDRTARIEWVSAPYLAAVPLEHPQSVTALTFSPDGSRLITGSRDYRMRVWDIRRRELWSRGIKAAEGSACWWAAFERDSSRDLAYAGERGGGKWTVPSALGENRPSTPIDEELQLALALLPEAGPFPSARVNEGFGQHFDSNRIQTAQQLLIAALGNAPITTTAIASHSSGFPLAIAHTGGELTIWTTDDSTGTKPAWSNDSQIECLDVSPDKRQMIVGTKAGIAHILSLRPDGSWNSRKKLHHDGAITSVQFSPDGGRIVTASADNTARVWNTADGTPVAPPLRHDQAATSLGLLARFTPDGRRVLTTGSEDLLLRAWNAESGTEELQIYHQSRATSMFIAPGGSRVYIGGRTGTVSVFDLEHGELLRGPEWLPRPSGNNTADTFCINMSADGSRTVLASRGGIRVLLEPPVEAPLPPWFLDLAEAVVGLRLVESNLLQPVPFSEISTFESRIPAPAEDDSRIARWARWLVSDPDSRDHWPE